MKYRKIRRITTDETYEVEAESEEAAQAVLESGELDPIDSKIVGQAEESDWEAQ